MRAVISIALVIASITTAAAAPRVQPVKPTPALADAMAKVAFMRGVWVGPAKGTGIDGNAYTVTQTSALGYASYVAMVDPKRGGVLRAKVLALRAKYP